MFYSIKVILASLIVMCFIACNNKKEEKLYEEMSLGLEKSNIQIQTLCRNYLNDFNIKMSKAETEERTSLWLPKAEKAKHLSDDLLTFIKSNFYQNNIALTASDAQIKQLYDKLTDYRATILSIDSAINKESNIPNITCESNNGKEISKDDFINAFKLNNRLFIINLINRVNRIECSAIGWCNGQVEVVDGEGFYYSFHSIASQNAIHFKANDKLRITAGTGAFYKHPKLNITIDGAPILLNIDGVAEYETTVGSKLGKHIKIVKISYMRPSGETMVVEKEITYTVDE